MKSSAQPYRKPDDRVPGVAQVDVLAARARHQLAELGVGERAGERDRAADGPGGQHERRRVERAGDEVGVDEDARPDDSANDDHRRVEGAERTPKRHARILHRRTYVECEQDRMARGWESKSVEAQQAERDRHEPAAPAVQPRTRRVPRSGGRSSWPGRARRRT